VSQPPTIQDVHGIDLGTVNSAVARVDEYGRPVVVKNDVNEPTTPSVVYFESEANVLVGAPAKEMTEVAPDKTVQFVKRFMGRGNEFLFEAFGKAYTPEEISALILKGLVAKSKAGALIDVRRAVITVPAYFDDAQRTATKIAGGLAGIEVIDILDEPIAAAIAYGARVDGPAERILVFDLGGGTFDVSILSVSPAGWKILVTGGRHMLGGVNWDDRVMTHLATLFREAHGVDPLDDPFACQELRNKAEAAKKHLSAKTVVPVHLAFDGHKFRTELTREKFEELTADLLAETLQATAETLDDLEKKTGSRRVDRVLLVGGSSRMPMVERAVTAALGVRAESFDPDEAVAKGAAVWAVKRTIDGLAAPELKRQLEQTRDPKFFLSLRGRSGGNVASHTYGILAWQGDTPIVAPLLGRNQAVPYTYVSGKPNPEFGTAADNQAEIEVILMEADGDSLDPAVCKEIGRGTVELPPGIPRNSEVLIQFEYAADGTMSLHAREKSSGRNCDVRVSRDGVMSGDQARAAGDKLAVVAAA
jgi:molecular chaperone DnaK